MNKNILLTFVVFLVALSLAELFFRVNGKYTTYQEKIGGRYTSPFEAGDRTWYHTVCPYEDVNHKFNEFAVSWKANNEGLKGKDFVVSKDKIRIVMVGDSYTEGVGADNDSSFPRQLSYLLADSFSGKTEVWDCGIGGSDPVYEFRLYNDKLLKYNPDMVIVVINPTDIHDVIVKGGFERFRPDSTVQYRKGPWFEPFYAHSYIIRRIVHDGFKYNWEFIQLKDTEEAKQDAYKKIETAIDSFALVCKDKHIKLLFVFHPSKYEIEYKTEYLMVSLIKYCKANNLSYVDIKEQLQSKGIDSSNVQSLFWAEDGHCNNKGYHYFAESVWKKVVEMLDK